jgi:hypothetical protein
MTLGDPGCDRSGIDVREIQSASNGRTDGRRAVTAKPSLLAREEADNAELVSLDRRSGAGGGA